MTLVQGLCLAVSFVASFLAGDLLKSHNRDGWPHTAAILALALVGGYLRNVWIVTVMLGAAGGWVVIGGVNAYLAHASARAEKREAREERARRTTDL